MTQTSYAGQTNPRDCKQLFRRHLKLDAVVGPSISPLLLGSSCYPSETRLRSARNPLGSQSACDPLPILLPMRRRGHLGGAGGRGGEPGEAGHGADSARVVIVRGSWAHEASSEIAAVDRRRSQDRLRSTRLDLGLGVVRGSSARRVAGSRHGARGIGFCAHQILCVSSRFCVFCPGKI